MDRLPSSIFMDRARELTEFAVRRGRNAFQNWPVPDIFRYVFFHVAAGTAFVVRKGGQVATLAFAWPAAEAEIRSRAAAGKPQFDWRTPANDRTDSIFLAQVIGSAGLLPRIAAMGRQRWPDALQRKIFTYRHGKLVELKPEVIRKMTINHQPSTIN